MGTDIIGGDLKLDWLVGSGCGAYVSVLAENITTSWLHLASWNLLDSQLS